MVKFSRFLFILGLMLSVLGCVSLVINLTVGKKLIAENPMASSPQYKSVIDKAMSEMNYLYAHIPQKILEALAGLACGIVGIVYTTGKKKDIKFLILSVALVLLTASQFLAKSWLAGSLYFLATLFGFIAISKGIKEPEPVTSGRF